MSKLEELKETLRIIMAFASALENAAKIKAEAAEKAKDSTDPLTYVTALAGAQFDRGYSLGLISCVNQALEIIGREPSGEEEHENMLN